MANIEELNRRSPDALDAREHDQRRLRFSGTLIGGHVHVKVRAGQPGSRGLCGTIVMRPDEWALLGEALNHSLAIVESAADDDR